MAKKYQYLDEAGLQKLSKGILQHVNQRIEERIATSIDEKSDDEHVASAAAVYKLLASQSRTSIKTVKGDINTVVPIEDRDSSVIYYQKDDDNDKTWTQYIWDAENQQWISIGDSGIDLSNYYSKDDINKLVTDLGVDTLRNSVNKNTSDISAISEKIADLTTEVSNKIDKSDVGTISNSAITSILSGAYTDTDPFKYAEASSATDVYSAIAAAATAENKSVAIKISKNLTLTDDSTINIPAGVTAEVNIPAGVTLAAANKPVFVVADGGTLTITGDGTVSNSSTAYKSSIQAEAGSTVNIEGGTFTATNEGSVIYAKDNATVNISGGNFRVATTQCIGVNNTTGGANINISGGEFYSNKGYAMYIPAFCNINITGGTVQGINIRMGNLTIGGSAKIIPTVFTKDNHDEIGTELNTSGCIWYGDTIAVDSGQYTDNTTSKIGVDTTITVKDDATVSATYRSAIGIYEHDLQANAKVTVNIENGSNVTTTDADCTAIKVYDHDYIKASATAAGKTYDPKFQTTVDITVDGSKVAV